MFDAGIAFTGIMIFGVILYGKFWWDGPGVGLKFTKWFFGILIIVALIVGGITYAGFFDF